MDVPADQSTRAVAQRPPPGTVRRARRRRPTGAAPPLPHHVQTSGVGWLIASVVLVALSAVVFARGLRGLAVDVTVADDAVVRWLAGLDAPGLVGGWRVLAAISSWWVLNGLLVGLLVALLVLRRFRHLIVLLILVQLMTLVVEAWVGPLAQRPRPFGVVIQAGWGGWALPPLQLTFFALGLVTVLYTLVPEGRWRNTGKWVATGLLALTALGRIALGADAPTDVLVAAAIGVTIPLVAFRLFAPNEVFPVTYRRGRAGDGDPAGAGGPAWPGRRRPQALRAGRLGRLHPAADHRQGRPAQLPVWQAVRQGPSPRRPLVQAGARAAVRPAGGREAVQHGASAGAAGGLRAAAVPRCRTPQCGAVRVRGAHTRTGVPAGHRVLRRRGRA